jgi:hypothetical protein
MRIEFAYRETGLSAITDTLCVTHSCEVPAFDFTPVSRPLRTVLRRTDVSG